ncbi:hypothetical protein BCR34DRAFT_595971 [Clohesyomyces aquaticus]|uniref:EKC/KEOPS complex subunit GON7 n=1 Tax=Clohesyomyces aquaticus TaxID=1231657 RepID=A0A1Y2A8B1_9PLEO|nr:hypothetical protein BCR34DRAFT_595971 [Clohesyomyces aquaticus]
MAQLTAAYTSAANQPPPQSFAVSLPAPGIKQLQADVNVFLTDKMDEDKAIGIAKAEEAKEEANYGEEVVEAE